MTPCVTDNYQTGQYPSFTKPFTFINSMILQAHDGLKKQTGSQKISYAAVATYQARITHSMDNSAIILIEM